MLCRFLALRATVWATIDISQPAQKKNRQNLPTVAYIGKSPLGRPLAYCGHVTARYANGRPNHCTKCHSRQIRCQFVAKSAGSGESVFTSIGVVLYGLTVFKQKKGSATISLGLNYCSMGSSRSLSCDTVPLMLLLSWI
jgi:hypothetical protein